MAKLQPFVADARLPATAGNVEIDARYPIDTTGRAVAALADKALDLSGTALVAAVAAREEGEVTRAIADTTQKLDKERLDLEADGDYLGREAKFNARAKEIEAETVANLSKGAARLYRQKLGTLYSSQAHSVRWQAAKDQNDALRVQLETDTDAMIESALSARNQVERLAKLAEIDDALKRAQSTGVLTGAQYLSWKKAKLEKYDELTVSRVMRTAPGTALALLNDKTATPNLDPLRREQLKIQATARAEQMSLAAKQDAAIKVAGVEALLNAGRPASNFGDAWAAAAPFKDLRARLTEAQKVYEATTEFRELPINQMAERVRLGEAAEKAAGTDISAARILDAQRQILDATLKAYRADQMATAQQRNPVAAEMLAAAERGMSDPAAPPAARESARQSFQAALLQLQRFQQTDGGVPPVMTRLLTKSTATALEENLVKLAGQQRLDFLEAQRAKYGSLWPQVLRQLDEGKKLPADVKLLGAMPGTLRANRDAALIAEAYALPEKRRDELISDGTVRARFPALAEAATEPLRETMRRVPGENEALGDYVDGVKRVAEYLYAQRRASSPEAATRQAYQIVVGNHWATAGSVRIPKIDGVPVADPTMVAAYGDYLRRNLDKYYLAVPEATAALRHVTEARRLEMWRDHLKAFGALTADRFENGVVFRDGEGRIVRGQNGQAIAATWAEIANDRDFQAWLRQGNRPGQMQPRGGERFQNMPGLAPTYQPEAR